MHRWAAAVVVAVAGLVAAQGCKGSCASDSDCPSNAVCMYPQGSCSAQGVCEYPKGDDCGIVIEACGCDGKVVSAGCNSPDGYWSGPTLGPTLAPSTYGPGGNLVCGDVGVSGDAGCIIAGAKCSAAAPCCYGGCTDTGVCECLPNGMACGNATCCSTNCDINGNCSCLGIGRSCDLDPARSDKECCSGLCTPDDGGDAGTCP